MIFPTRSAKVFIPLLALSFATAMAPAIADSSSGDNTKSGVIYNSVITPLPGNLDSQPFEAQQVSEFGNAVNFSSGSSHTLSKVVVTMSSWGCVSGSWNLKTCSTPEDATFSQPITLNIYGPSGNNGVTPGDLITSVTQTFDIKYRPSASPLCVGAGGLANGKWFDKSSKTCFNGLAQNITFNLKNVKVGNSAIFGIAYNTTHYGYAPIGEGTACFHTLQGCGYDSLNVALTEDPTNVKVGSSVVPGKPWINSRYRFFYADGNYPYNPDPSLANPFVPLTSPTNLFGTFRMDSPNVAAWWGVNAPYSAAPWYVPAFKVFANGEGNSDNQSSEQSSDNKAPDNKIDGKHGIKKD